MCERIKPTKLKNKKIPLSGHFTIPKEKSRKEAQSTPISHKYMTAHFPDLVQAPQ
jgi:hypothetical protein